MPFVEYRGHFDSRRRLARRAGYYHRVFHVSFGLNRAGRISLYAVRAGHAGETNALSNSVE